jgi:hypothetical protein
MQARNEHPVYGRVSSEPSSPARSSSESLSRRRDRFVHKFSGLSRGERSPSPSTSGAIATLIQSSAKIARDITVADQKLSATSSRAEREAPSVGEPKARDDDISTFSYTKSA